MGKGKILIIVGLLIIFGTLGYYFIGLQGENNNLSEKMKTASQDYFKKYMRTIETASAYEVTLKELLDARSNGENYDLQGLEKCNKTKTHATITIDMNDGKIKKIKVKLNC